MTHSLDTILAITAGGLLVLIGALTVYVSHLFRLQIAKISRFAPPFRQAQATSGQKIGVTE